LARRELGDRGGEDLTRHVAAEDVGERDAPPGESSAGPEIEVVESAGSDAHHDLAGAREGVRDLPFLEDLWPSVPIDDDGSHLESLL
jgi:hypothetical protein